MRISAKAGQQILEVEVDRDNGHYTVVVDGERHVVDAHKLEGDFYSILTAGRSYEVSVEAKGDGYRVRHGAAEQLVEFTDPSRRARTGFEAADGLQRVLSVMPGKVVRVLVQEGDAVSAGQGLVVVEAMKMENEIAAARDGKVRSVAVREGQAVEGGALLVELD